MLDKNTISDLKQRNIKNIKIFFYDAGCSGTKVDLEENPDTTNLVEIKSPLLIKEGIKGWSTLEDKNKFNNSIITKTVVADHTGKEKIRYIFSSKEIKDRCGCGSSFSFDKKELKIDFEKLKNLKNNLKKGI